MRAASTSLGHEAPWVRGNARSAPSSAAGSRIGSVLAVIRAATVALAREMRLRRDARRLAALDDHMLKDIGLSRGEIDSAVRDGGPHGGFGLPGRGAIMPPIVTLPPWSWTEWR